MNAKQAKQLRKASRKLKRRFLQQLQDEVYSWPWHRRLWFAWHVVRGKK